MVNLDNKAWIIYSFFLSFLFVCSFFFLEFLNSKFAAQPLGHNVLPFFLSSSLSQNPPLPLGCLGGGQ